MASSRTTALRDIRAQTAEAREQLRAEQWKLTGTVVAAGTMMSVGLKRRSLGGTVVALAGGALLYRGLQSQRRALAAVARAARRAVTGEETRHGQLVEVEHTLIVRRPIRELYRLWREPSTLSRLMEHFADVTPTVGEGRHFRIHGPLGREVSWDSRLVEERAPEFHSWESTEDSPMKSSGWVRLRPAPESGGTEVTLHLAFQPPGGALAEALAQRMRGIPATQVAKVLRRFKSLAETGEISTEDTPKGYELIKQKVNGYKRAVFTS
ncbi:MULTISPECIES: SRPBCC family protein [unclassified Corallococcus]|uniref:SRPBCC family protein n=1 Tax=unclassified Corallococcus TaxID=2685029 RepID=UPI001A8F4407|nr:MULTISPECIES: SRPBCC family protein [unclassified Corallococcus]MBN9684167.1 SRPBCC family protein [Corallococcus sp. NCSPR001]WAS84343.1 SRPBCC family protein [Corallococcus sp. NCRR]